MAAGRKSNTFLELLSYFTVREAFDFARSRKCLRTGPLVRHANGVGHLHERLAAQAAGHEVFGDVARCVCRRAVHFGWVLA